MTVTALTQIVPRLWRGYPDPGLPVGMYVSQLNVTGDAGGGNMRLLFRFRTEAGPISGRFFNLEQMEAGTPVGGGLGPALAASLRTDGFDRVGNTSMLDRGWVFLLRDTSRAGEDAADYERLPRFPIFLGQTDLTPGGSSSVIIETANVDAAVFQAVIQGYIWEPRSVNATGGLRRPQDSLYG